MRSLLPPITARPDRELVGSGDAVPLLFPYTFGFRRTNFKSDHVTLDDPPCPASASASGNGPHPL